MKKIFFLFTLSISALLSSYTFSVNAQGVGINPSGNNPDPSAMIDVNSTTKGALIPRLTTAQRNGIASPAKGLMIYNLDCDNINVNVGTPSVPNWVFVNSANTFPSAPTAATNTASLNQIVWNWNSVAGATGYKWNTTNNYGAATDNGGSISYTQTGLSCSNAYTLYVWAYNVCGNSTAATLTQSTSACPSAYCSVNSTCAGSITDSRDGKVYSVVQIGTQCWMAQSLNVGTFVTGATTHTSGGDNGNTSIQKYCYGDNTANCTTYGGLYQWNEMMAYTGSVSGNGPGPQGICPTGWHLPTDNEYKCLEMSLGMSQSQVDISNDFRGTDEGGRMKQAGTSLWTAPNTGATNSSGWTGLPGGWGGGFAELGNQGRWATATEGDSGNAWGRYLYSNDARVLRYNNLKTYGFAVRCVKN